MKISYHGYLYGYWCEVIVISCINIKLDNSEVRGQEYSDKGERSTRRGREWGGHKSLSHHWPQTPAAAGTHHHQHKTSQHPSSHCTDGNNLIQLKDWWYCGGQASCQYHTQQHGHTTNNNTPLSSTWSRGNKLCFGNLTILRHLLHPQNVAYKHMTYPVHIMRMVFSTNQHYCIEWTTTWVIVGLLNNLSNAKHNFWKHNKSCVHETSAGQVDLPNKVCKQEVAIEGGWWGRHSTMVCFSLRFACFVDGGLPRGKGISLTPLTRADYLFYMFYNSNKHAAQNKHVHGPCSTHFVHVKSKRRGTVNRHSRTYPILAGPDSSPLPQVEYRVTGLQCTCTCV